MTLNKERLCVIALAVVLLAVGCKRGTRNSDNAVATIDEKQNTAISSDSGVTPDGNVPADKPTTQKLTLEQDSAEITNLRLFTRKQKEIYNAALLVGEWVHGTEHEVYFSNGTGRMWDTSEDVSSAEAQRFEWSLDSNLLTIICHLELGGVLPKRYVVTFADDENLAYQDLYGTAFLWDKKDN